MNQDNIPPMGDDPQKKKNKFNIYWIYGILFISLIAYNLMRDVNSSGVETDQQKFYEMVRQGDVDKIKTIRNKNWYVFSEQRQPAEKATLYKSLLKDPKKYDAVLKISTPDQPQLYFSIIKDETFAKEMGEFYNHNPVYVRYPIRLMMRVSFSVRSSAPCCQSCSSASFLF